MASHNFEKYLKSKGKGSYFGCLLGVLAIGFLFLPQMGQQLLNGEVVRFTSFKLIFGGEEALTASSGTYYFTYGTNIPYIVWSQIIVLGVLCSALGRRSRRNVFASFLFFLLAFIAFFFSRFAVLKVNPNLPAEGLIYSYGFYLCAVVTFVAALVQLMNYGFAVKFHRALHAVK